jgi:hypothetical protein
VIQILELEEVVQLIKVLLEVLIILLEIYLVAEVVLVLSEQMAQVLDLELVEQE